MGQGERPPPRRSLGKTCSFYKILRLICFRKKKIKFTIFPMLFKQLEPYCHSLFSNPDQSFFSKSQTLIFKKSHGVLIQW